MGMQLIETIEVGAGGAASIEFTSIPQDGVDLVLKVSTRCSSTAVLLEMQFNADTSASYAYRWLRGTGSATSSGNAGSGYPSTYAMIGWVNGSSATANTFNNQEAYIPNYSGSAIKSFSSDAVDENNATASYQTIQAGGWNNTSAITSVKLFLNAGNFAQYSTASLYKITAD